MTADTPVTPSADDLARALAHIDASAIPGAAWCDEATFSAVFAMARTSLAYDMADLEADEVPIDVSAAECERLLAPIERRRNAALSDYNASRADLVRLATGAQGGAA